MSEKIVLFRAVQTSTACPSQWDTWAENGQYYYCRYRHGEGSVTLQPSADYKLWLWPQAPVIEFEYGSSLDGCMEFAQFCELAGLELSPNFEFLSWGAQAILKINAVLNDEIDIDTL